MLAYECIAAGMFLAPLCIEPLCRVTSSAQGVYALMSNISSYSSYPDVIYSIKMLDIEASVKVMERLIKELNVNHDTKTLKEIINLLKLCMNDIVNELSSIHEKLAYNNKIWVLQGIRGYKFSNAISNLQLYKKQLDNRTQMLFDVLKNHEYLVMKESIIDQGFIIN